MTYGDVSVESAAVAGREGASGDVTLRVSVKNAGSAATQDVVQVYVKDEVSPHAVPNHSLCAFARISLQAGEAKEVELKVPGSAFLVVNEEGAFAEGSGSYVLYVGVGQPDARTAALTGKKSVEVAVK